MFIDQLVTLRSKDETEIIKPEDDPFDPATGHQFDHHMASISPNPIEKLILNINLILYHGSSPRLDPTSLPLSF